MSEAALMTTVSTMVKEELPVLFLEYLQKVDPYYVGISRSSIGVNRSKVGRGWKVMHRFRTSISGQYEPANPDANTAADATNKSVMAYGSLQSFPKPLNTPHKGSMVRTIDLNCHVGNFGLPTHVLQLAAMSPIAAEDIADDLRGLAEIRARGEAISFYTGNKFLGVVSEESTAAATTGHTIYTAVTLKPDSSRISWFTEGMLVNIYDDEDATTLINFTSSAGDLPLVVDAVDLVNGTITIKSLLDNTTLDHASNGLADAGIANGQYIFPHTTAATTASAGYKWGHFGLDDWIKSSGQILEATMQGRLDTSAAAFSLATYPGFKSVIVTDNAGPLTETVLNNVIGAFVDAYGNTLDTLITTRRVIQKFLEQPTLGNSRMNYDRTSKPLSIASGWNTVTYEYEGRTLEVKISSYCQSGVLYGIKMGEGNITRYIPPRSIGIGGISGPGSRDDLGEEIQFINPYGGTNGIFSLTSDTSGRKQPMVEAPFEQYSQIAPKDVRGIKISGITESTEI